MPISKSSFFDDLKLLSLIPIFRALQRSPPRVGPAFLGGNFQVLGSRPVRGRGGGSPSLPAKVTRSRGRGPARIKVPPRQSPTLARQEGRGAAASSLGTSRSQSLGARPPPASVAGSSRLRLRGGWRRAERSVAEVGGERGRGPGRPREGGGVGGEGRGGGGQAGRRKGDLGRVYKEVRGGPGSLSPQRLCPQH